MWALKQEALIEVTTSEYYGCNYTLEFELVVEVKKRVLEPFIFHILSK
jgi:hypothetical protein